MGTEKVGEHTQGEREVQEIGVYNGNDAPMGKAWNVITPDKRKEIGGKPYRPSKGTVICIGQFHMEADAVLDAAAPTMLETLKQCSELVKKSWDVEYVKSQGYSIDGWNLRIYRMMDEAIAKATKKTI